LAGTLADIDLLIVSLGPDAYLAGHYTFTHSLIGTIVVIGIAVLFVRLLPSGSGPPGTLRLRSGQEAALTCPGLGTIVLATSLAAIVHVLVDLATSSGVGLLWPFRITRFAWDYLPFLDPWVLAMLVAGIALPQLFALVSSEIGAKEKASRGQNGALVALALVVFYGGARALLHGYAVSQLDAHSYRGESPRHAAAFPDTLSLVTWRSVVETASQICTADVPTAGTRFDPQSAACLHKPEESAALTVAQKTGAAQAFLRAARFPKASVGVTADGSEIVLRDMRDTAQNETLNALAARVLLDRKRQVTIQSVVWARQAGLR